MAKYTVYKGYKNDKPVSTPKPEKSPEPMILTVQEGIPILFEPCESPAVRIVHPTNPRAPSKNFGITMLYIPPQGSVMTGSHEPEEVYVILEGQGTMQFAEYKRQVRKGDFIYLPPWCVHGIENTGTEMVIVLVATSPTNP